jgi:hypothetical protein
MALAKRVCSILCANLFLQLWLVDHCRNCTPSSQADANQAGAGGAAPAGGAARAQ